ncbi:enoyl-CoA hydratase/isomerase family protein [Ammoniphilus sp. 3BR4]|uniref:enoyl-CoA hydratase/isomerase family protein n=1 Tax=Ammoniphilus sp. 3BR4 TaxID=3158265 RepID=UPI00346781F7
MTQVLLKRNQCVAKITINRPEVRNAINDSTMDELNRCLDEIENDELLRVVILTGEGEKAFISGGDIKEFESLTTADHAREMSEKMRKILNRIEQLPIPVIAALNGDAMGGGCETALACDFRIAVEGTSLGFLQVKLGIITGWGSGPRLLHIVGRAQASRLLMLGERITAEEAQRIGLVHQVVPRHQFVSRVEELAKSLCSSPPLAVRGFKLALKQWHDASLHSSQALETEIFSTLWVSQDHKEAVRSFFEKRDPVFTGE